MNKQIVLFSAILFTLLFYGCQMSQTTTNEYVITDYGAKGDSASLNTKAIQKAVDEAANNGGGTVVVPEGTFSTGTIFLKDHVTLRVEENAMLYGSPDINDYTKMSWGHNEDRQPYHLIVAKDAENVIIEGKGTIDGNGKAFWQEYETDEDGNMVTPRWLQPKEKKVSPLIEITESRNIEVKDVTIKTGGGWNLHLHNSDLVRVKDVNIVNNRFSPNSDGINATGCNDVMISGCYIKTCDDAVCLKTTPDSRETHRVTVTNCIIETLCVGLKLGCNESFKDITDVTFNNCVVHKSSRAFGLYVREGGTFKNISVSNIVANTNAPLIFNRPIQIMVEKRNEDSELGAVKNVTVSNFICETEGRIILTAQKGSVVDNVVLRDITLEYPMIEDPRPYVEGSGSSQFPKEKYHPGAMGARASIVADNITDLVIDNMNIKWPQTDTTPEAWRYPERIENGCMRIHEEDYSDPRQTEFSVLWGKNLKGGYIFAPLADASHKKMPEYDLEQSSIEVME